MKKKDRDYKQPAPVEYVPTELGSAVYANVKGRPTDEEYLIKNKKSQDDVEDGAKDSEDA